MRDVDLDESTAAPADDGPAPPDPSFLERVRRHPRWLAGAAVTVVALVGYQLVSDRRVQAADEARAASLADLASVLDPVDPTFPVLQHRTSSSDGEEIPAEVAAYLGGAALAGGVLVSSTLGLMEGDARLFGVDPATAEQVWQTTVEPPEPGASRGGAWCWPQDASQALSVSSEGTAVRCVVTWMLASSPEQDVSRSSRLGNQATALLQVDATDGTVRHRIDLPVDSTLGQGAWGVVSGTVADARVTLESTRWDGTARWTRTLDMPSADGRSSLSVSVVGDRVLVADGYDASGWVLSADDGSTLAALPGGAQEAMGLATLLPTGAVVVADPAFAPTGPSAERAAMLVRPDGTVVSFDGDHQERVDLDDGTLRDALLTGTAAPEVGGVRLGEDQPSTPPGAVVRLREADGTVRWQVPGLDVLTAIAVDGLVVVRTVDEVAAIDARSGDVRWRSSAVHDGVETAQVSPLLTDGRVILVAHGAQLDALSFRGEPVWSAYVEDVGDEHVVRPGPAPNPAPSGAAAVEGDALGWFAAASGHLGLAVYDSGAQTEEHFVFGHR